MTTAQQFGFALPVGTDLIRNGDDAITQNANKSAELFTDVFGGDFTPKPIPLNADLNNLGDGFWYARTPAQSASVLNKPTGQIDTPFEVFIRTSVEGSFRYQLQDFSGYSATKAGYWKRNTSNATGAAFLPWARMDNELVSSTGLAGIANMLRVQEFKDAIGKVTTNGRAAVALRFDHGLTNFNTSIRPLLQARNFKYGLALSSRNFNAGENAGVTAAMVNGWNLAEVWNHGANSHQDESSIDGLTDQIVTGLAELQAALPAKKIWGYMVPGTGGSGQGGFGGGATPEAFYKTLAGDLILTNHAVSSGSFTGTARRPMDGEVRQGMAHFTMEAQTVARVKLEVDNAISTGTGLQLMMHPSLLNGAGYLTTSQLTEILDYIKSKQDNGEIVVLSPYEMMVADIQKPTERDTQWRDVTALLTGIVSGSVYLRRTGHQVWLRMSDVKLADGASNIVLGSGFLAPFAPDPLSFEDGNVRHANTTTLRRVNISQFGGVRIFRGTTADLLFGTVSWPTSRPWITDLPGVAM